MSNKHVITPPDELVRQWRQQWNCRSHNLNPDLLHDFQQYLITQVAQWCWDQRSAATEAELRKARDEELGACIELLDINGCPGKWLDMLLARRPKQPSKVDLALKSLEGMALPEDAFDTISRALERLKELEATND